MLYETSVLRAVLALIVGAVAGGVIVSAVLSISFTMDAPGARFSPALALLIFVYAFVVWGAGLFAIAPLPWIALHVTHRRGWPYAVILGGLATFVTMLAFLTNGFGLVNRSGFSATDAVGPTWIDGWITGRGWLEAAEMAGIVALIGTVVGFAVWRVAYRHTSPP